MARQTLASAFLVAASLCGCTGETNSGDSSAPRLSEQVACATAPGVTVLYSGLVSGLSTDGASVIATTSEDVLRLPLAGGAAVTIAQPDGPSGLFTLGDRAYFSASHLDGPVDPQGKQPSTTSLYAVPLTGGAPTLVLDQAPEMGASATDGDSLYFASYGPSAVARFTPPASVVDIALDSAAVGINAIAVHGDWLYVAGNDLDESGPLRGVIERVPRSGGPAERIVSGIGNPWNLVASDAGLFWVEDPPVGTFGNGHIARAALDGSQVSSLLAYGASALALQGQHLYFLTDIVGRVPVSGGAVEVIASGLGGASFLQVVGGNVVWVDNAIKSLSDSTPMTIMTACIPGD